MKSCEEILVGPYNKIIEAVEHRGENLGQDWAKDWMHGMKEFGVLKKYPNYVVFMSFMKINPDE